MLQYSKIQILSIVVVGKFNPVIFQPTWFALKELLGENECNSAKIDIIHRDLVRFSIDWFELEITQDRFQIVSTKEAYFEPLRDLTVSIFKLLNETPINSFGFNISNHYEFRNKDETYNFGNFLVPLKNWADSFEEPRVLSLEIIDQKRTDGIDGKKRFTIQPSDKFKNNGVFTNFNNHIIVNTSRVDELVKLLEGNWKNSFNENNSLIKSLWDKFKA